MSFQIKMKKSGDVIQSSDWNEAMSEISRLENSKLNSTGGDIEGTLSIKNPKEPSNRSAFRLESLKEGAQLSLGDTKALSIGKKGGIGIGVTNPHQGLAVDGPVIRKIWAATGLGPSDEQDNGLVVSRVLKFEKLREDTAIRIVYCDNFRVEGQGAMAGRWEILVDQVAPPGGPIYLDVYGNSGGYTNYHLPATIRGFALGLAPGKHIVSIKVGEVPDHSAGGNRYTGWHRSTWSIEAEEVWIHKNIKE